MPDYDYGEVEKYSKMDLSEQHPDQFEVSNEVFQAQNIYTQRPNQRNSSRERVRNGEHD